MKCRFCWEAGVESEFVSPCDCSWSMKNVHIECIQKWIRQSKSKTCNVCNSKYNMVIISMGDESTINEDEDNIRCVDVTSCICFRIFLIGVIVFLLHM